MGGKVTKGEVGNKGLGRREGRRGGQGEKWGMMDWGRSWGRNGDKGRSEE